MHSRQCYEQYRDIEEEYAQRRETCDSIYSEDQPLNLHLSSSDSFEKTYIHPIPSGTIEVPKQPTYALMFTKEVQELMQEFPDFQLQIERSYNNDSDIIIRGIFGYYPPSSPLNLRALNLALNAVYPTQNKMNMNHSETELYYCLNNNNFNCQCLDINRDGHFVLYNFQDLNDIRRLLHQFRIIRSNIIEFY